MADPNANHAIILTPPGTAAIAVVRIAGPAVPNFLAEHFSRPVTAARCVHGQLRDGQQVLDDVVVVIDAAGRLADISMHGGTWVLRSALDLLARSGFAELRPDPLTGILPDIAVDADDPIEQEMLTCLPLARTPEALHMLLAQPAAWQQFLRSPPDPRQAQAMLSDHGLWWLLNPPRLAIVGLPNAGKSTLANQLFGRDRSITADLPGTTRDWVSDLAPVDGLAVHLIDTPGLRPTDDDLERQAIARSAPQISAADLLLLVLDASLPPARHDDLLQRFPSALRILNKSDLELAAWKDFAALRTIASTGQGIPDLRRAIRRHFCCENMAPFGPRWWTPRQRSLLQSIAPAP
jgi:tRNA modification GTPase